MYVKVKNALLKFTVKLIYCLYEALLFITHNSFHHHCHVTTFLLLFAAPFTLCRHRSSFFFFTLLALPRHPTQHPQIQWSCCSWFDNNIISYFYMLSLTHSTMRVYMSIFLQHIMCSILYHIDGIEKLILLSLDTHAKITLKKRWWWYLGISIESLLSELNINKIQSQRFFSCLDSRFLQISHKWCAYYKTLFTVKYFIESCKSFLFSHPFHIHACIYSHISFIFSVRRKYSCFTGEKETLHWLNIDADRIELIKKSRKNHQSTLSLLQYCTWNDASINL